MHKSLSISKKSLPIKIGLFALAVLIIAGTLYTLEANGVIDLYSKNISTTDTNPTSATGEVPSANPTNTVDYGAAKPTDNQPITDKDSSDNTAIPSNPELSAIITSTRKSTEGNTYLIKVAVTGTQTGTCHAAMTKGDNTATASGQIILSAGQYSCGGLEIPMSSLAESGTWNLSVTVTDSSGATTTKSQKVIL